MRAGRHSSGPSGSRLANWVSSNREPKLRERTTTVIVVPCYNEGRRLPVSDFDTFLKRSGEISFVFVDDGSGDNTAERLREIERAHPDLVEILTLARNQGKAGAVREGMRAAFARNPQFVGYWDADLATPLEEIPRFVRTLEEDKECLVLLGSRVRLLGWSIERRAVRHYAGRVFATVASLTLGLPVYDTQCGAKLFRVMNETQALFSDPFVTRWIFDVELLARLLSARRSAAEVDLARGVREIPVLAWRDVAGSSLRAHDFLVAAWDLLRIRQLYRHRG